MWSAGETKPPQKQKNKQKETNKFRQIKMILYQKCSFFYSNCETAYQHMIVLLRNKEVRGVRKPEVKSASVKETMKKIEVVRNM